MKFRLITALIVGACVFLTLPEFAFPIEVAVASADASKTTAGRFSYSADSAGINIVYHDDISNSDRKYHQEKFDECSSMAIYQLSAKGQIAIDGSCSSRGGQVFIHIYEWNKKIEDWCLIREVTGEKPDIPSGDLFGSRQVARVVGCPRIGNDGPYRYEEKSALKNDISDEIVMFKNAQRDKATLKQYIANMPFYVPLELADNLDVVSVQDVNDIAFYLIENGRADDSAPLLQRIVEKYPDRVVAKLNLADAYWQDKMIPQAKEMYQRYAKQMGDQGKSARVPERVLSRINQQ
ncbi:tetratricopeptide repeat protein [Paraburkholderia sediminicola]|uniref:tetratricopeptide repeat protein n=1 Tax=Paraburkholderia sediminicola TaxID=458836 RepID=UPI0038BE1355